MSFDKTEPLDPGSGVPDITREVNQAGAVLREVVSQSESYGARLARLLARSGPGGTAPTQAPVLQAVTETIDLLRETGTVAEEIAERLKRFMRESKALVSAFDATVSQGPFAEPHVDLLRGAAARLNTLLAEWNAAKGATNALRDQWVKLESKLRALRFT